MTDAPFTETHRRTLDLLGKTTPWPRNVAIHAALKEIDGLRQQVVSLHQDHRADVERWNTANAEANAEIDRLQKVIDAYERIAAKRLRETP